MIDRHIALAAASYVEAGQYRDALQERRFAGAVLADDDGDRPVEMQFEFLAQERQTERIRLGVGDRAGSSQTRRRYGAGMSACWFRFLAKGGLLGSPEGSAHPIRVVGENQEQKENFGVTASAQITRRVARRATTSDLRKSCQAPE